MGTSIEFDDIRLGDRIVVTQGSSLEGSDTEEYSTHRHVGNVTKTFRSSDLLDSDYIQTESLHFSRGGSSSKFRTYELISRAAPVVKVGDTVCGDGLDTLPNKTILSVASGLYGGPPLRVVDSKNRTLIWDSNTSYGFHLYHETDIFRVEFVPEA